MDKNFNFSCDFDEKFRKLYQQGQTAPMDNSHSFSGVVKASDVAKAASPAKAMALQIAPPSQIILFGHTIDVYIRTLLPNGVAEGSRHKEALKLADDLMILLDNNSSKVEEVLLSIKWVQDVVQERGKKEIDNIIEAAKSHLEKKEREELYSPRPSKRMQAAIEMVTGKKYRMLTAEQNHQNQNDVTVMCQNIGDEIKGLFRYYPLLKLLCHGMKLKHYVAAMFTGGAFGMTLMTRCWYQFYSAPGRKCRMNSILEVIGPPASGKHFMVDLRDIMMAPIKDADAKQIDALNKWNEEQNTAGANKTKSARPQDIFRCLPAESSASAIRDAHMNAFEMIDGEKWPVHLTLFDSELDNSIRQMKKDYMNITTLYLKAFHNEPHGAYLKSTQSQVGEYNVYLNCVYSGTDYALNKQVNVESYPTGLPPRLTIVPMAFTNYEMMEKRQYTAEDQKRDDLLKEWSYKLDKTKGEIPVKMLSDKLYEWTNNRMLDAEENDSPIQENLLKRCAWHAINYAIPFIVSRHWNEMTEDNGMWKAGVGFKVDKTDWKLCQLLVNAQYAFQQYFVGPVAEQYFEKKAYTSITSHQVHGRTMRAFNCLPDVFTLDDVIRCYAYNGTGSGCSRLKRLQDDGLIEKIRTGNDKGKYRKLTGLFM